MRIDNIKPKRGLLTRLAQRFDNDCFVACAIDWPDELLELFEKHDLDFPQNGYSEVIGGKMQRHVKQHTDCCDGDASVVWFPKVNKPLHFCIDGDSYSVYSGDVFLFNHKLPHSVSAVDKLTGTWYFMAQDVYKVGNGL